MALLYLILTLSVTLPVIAYVVTCHIVLPLLAAVGEREEGWRA